MNQVCKTIAMALGAFTLSACMTLGSNFDDSYVSQLQQDVTTRQQVLDRLGQPWRTGMENGLITWTYGLYQYGAFRDNQAKDLILKFDRKGVLKSYAYSTTDVKTD